MRLCLLAAAAGLIAATTQFAAEPAPVQVQLDVILLSGPADMFDRAEIKKLLPKPNSTPTAGFRPGVLSKADAIRLIQASRDKGGAKVLAEPKLVTLSGRAAHFLSGGQQAILSGPGGPNGPEVTYRNVGTELFFLPVVQRNGRIGMEVSPTLRQVNPGRGTQTAFGFVPGFDERSMRFVTDMGAAESAVICFRDDSQTTLVVATPQIIGEPAAHAAEKSPVEQRAAKSAAKLVRKYHEACAKGEPEKARKYARQALDLDPACFAESDPNTRAESTLNDSENLREVRKEWRRIWLNDQPSHLTPERVHGGID